MFPCAQGEKAEEATAAGASVVGAEDLVKAIQGGELDFDTCIATPDMMAQVGKVARVLVSLLVCLCALCPSQKKREKSLLPVRVQRP